MKRLWQIHPTEGDLRASLDHELPPARLARVQAHLADCRRCQARLLELRQAAHRAAAAVEALQTAVRRTAVSPMRFEEVLPMKSRMTRALPYVAAAAVFVFCVGSVALPPMRAVAAQWLSVFRTEKIAVVQVSPGDLGNSAQALRGLQGRITPELAQQLAHIEGPTQLPQPQPMTAAQAANLVGPLRQLAALPADMPAQPQRIDGMAPVVYTARPDVDAINNWLASQAIPARLDSSLKGQTLRITTPALVVRAWQDSRDRTLAFAQATTLQVEGSSAADLGAMAQFFGQLVGAPREILEQLKNIPDLAHTLVLPAGPGVGEQVLVDGVTGVYYAAPKGGSGVVVWSKGGHMYALGGPFGKIELLQMLGQ